MDNIWKIFVVIIGVVILIPILAGIFGYGCSSCSKVSEKELAENPCQPIFSNGKKNPHYDRSWWECKTKCSGKYTKLDLKTCACICE